MSRRSPTDIFHKKINQSSFMSKVIMQLVYIMKNIHSLNVTRYFYPKITQNNFS